MNYRLRIAVSSGILMLSVIMLSVSPIRAQVTTADIVGTVTDSSGAVLPNIKVVVKNLGTAEVRTTQADASGEYVINQLQPGHYSVRAQVSGFKAANVADVLLNSGDRAREDLSLQVGQLNEVVEVKAATPLLQTDTSALSSTVTQQAVQDLPLNGRNFVQLAQSVPGANEGPPSGLTSGARPDDRRQTSSISVNGQSDVINNEMIDGIDNNERIIGGIGARPSVDAISEVRVQTNDYTAEVGRTAGGVINVVTKSGTNKLHGSAFEYFRNDKLDARDFFAQSTSPKPELRQNQFGGSIGGAIIKNKTFFFGDYEGLRQVSGQSAQILTVPTLFEQQHCALATGCDFSDNGGPVIAPSAIDPVGLAYFQMFPQPDPDKSTATSSNFTSPALKRTQFSHTFDVRVDLHINDNNSFFARYTYNNVNTTIPGALPTKTVNGVTVNPGGVFFGFSGQAPDKAQNLQFDYDHIFNSNLLLELKGGYLRVNNASFPLNFGSNASRKLGMPGVNVDALNSGLSQVTFDNNVAPLGDDQFVPLQDIDNTYQYAGVITATRGRHNIKIGSTLIRRLATEGQNNAGIGTWAFVDLPSLVQGTSRFAQRVNELNVPHYRTWEPSVFVQDDWRAKNWLTLNLGVRYDVFTPFHEEKNRISNFDPSTGRIIVAGQNGVNDAAGVKTDWKDIAPRLGFAATLGRGMVLRGGYGISYFPSNYTSTASLKNPPFISTFVYQASTGNARKLSQGLDVPTPASATNPSGAIPDTVDLNFRASSLQQFNLTLQKDFSGNVLSISYVGMLGRHLLEGLGDIDVPAPGSTVRPFDATVPNVTNIGAIITEGASSYHALQAAFERRYKNGLTFNANYTWAHGIDDVSGLSNGGGSAYGANPYQISTFERGNSDLDIRHRIVFTANYVLPFGNSVSGFKGGVIQGWQVNFIDVWETGNTFTVINPGAAVSGIGFQSGDSDRPNQIASSSLSNPSNSEWFNTAAFQSQTPGTYGSERRNQLYGPHFRHFDFSMFKDFKPTEKTTLQFRAELFNLTNTPSFASPGVGNQDNVVTTPSFGRIEATSQNYTPRQIQFVLKFLF